jgi:hypothetical protein
LTDPATAAARRSLRRYPCRNGLDREQDDELEGADSAVTGYVPGAVVVPSLE